MKLINLALCRTSSVAQALGPVINQLLVQAVTDSEAQLVVSAAPNGTNVYLYVSLSAAPPTDADMISGAGAQWAGSIVMTDVPAGTPGPADLSPDTQYYLYAMAENAGGRSAISTASFRTAVPDTVAPVLSAPLTAVNNETSADLTVTSDEGNGELYVVVTQLQGAPSPAQMRAGQDSAGSDADYTNAGQAVSAPGEQTVSATGLTEAVHFAYFMQDDAAGNTSSVLEGGPFTPADVTAPILTSVEIVPAGTDAALLTFNTDTDEGNAYFVVQPTGDGAPSLAQIKAGSVGTVSGQLAISTAGPQSVDISGLSEATGYLAHVAQTDVAGNDSMVVSAEAEAITESTFAQTWTNGGGFSSFSEAGGSFTAIRTVGGGAGRAYSDAYLDGSIGDTITLELVFGAATTVTSLDVYVSFTTNARSVAINVDPSGGGTFTVEVEATSGAGPYSILLSTAQLGAIELQSAQHVEAPNDARAIVFMATGQSLNAGRGGSVVQATGGDAIMAAGGAHISAFNFWYSNNEHAPNAAEWASTLPFAEGGGGQSPLAGVANVLAGYEDRLLHSAAIGARTLETLHESFAQVSAAVERSVALLEGNGYDRGEIDLVFSIKHGEANANTGSTQSEYEALLTNYIDRCRIAARQALRNPSHVARFHVSFPPKQNQPDADRTIKKAILAVADTLPNIIIGEVYSVPMDTDRVHPTPEGYVLMGERAAYQVENSADAMRCMSFSGSGTAWTATFNKPVVRDPSFDWGANLNAANARDGLEVWDPGAGGYIAISSLSYSGNQIDITLATAPVGQPELRIAVQDTAGALVGASGLPGDIHNPDHVGCFVRSSDAGWVSPFNASYTHYDWCIPQTVEAT